MGTDTLFSRIRRFTERYERHISSVSLITGFIIDNITLQRIDLLFENLVFIGYLTLAGTGILIVNLYEGGAIRSTFLTKIKPFIPIVVQFAFGGLFSGFIIFYSRSASLAQSWPFILILLSILIGNEVLKKYYLHVVFQVAIFFLALFSFSIFYIPILVGSIGGWVFLLSGLVSLAAIIGYILLHTRFVPARIVQARTPLFLSIVGIFAIINLFYWTNILPPIPLSLKDAGVYHNVTRATDGYVTLGEDYSWYETFFGNVTIHVPQGAPVYVFSSVFAPTRLKTEIVHNWEYYNKSRQSWDSISKISFPITGGRDGGYRGYSVKTNVFPGKWRVDVETSRGQTIGRIKFDIETGVTPEKLVTEIK